VASDPDETGTAMTTHGETSAPTTTDRDAIGFLLRQHQEIRGLFQEVERAQGTEKKDAFHRLLRLLAVHETAEELVVHPRARSVAGDEVVEARLAEERQAKEVLARLDDMSPDDPGFEYLFRQLRSAVVSHAEHEEREEFPRLRQTQSPDSLEQMGQALRAAEAAAPTRPHPDVNTPAENLAAGPIAAVVDRVRDAIRKVTDRG
jgi:hemerythrin superfamily protein